jgi:hypothetical protein
MKILSIFSDILKNLSLPHPILVLTKYDLWGRYPLSILLQFLSISGFSPNSSFEILPLKAKH